jgi:WD40 repeat protein
MGRYSIRIAQEGTGLEVFHQGAELSVAPFETWLEDQKVKDFAWSPSGTYLAVLTDGDDQEQLVICDRRGTVSRRIGLAEHVITDLSWSPTEDQLAINVQRPGGRDVLVTYVQADVILSVGDEFSGSTSIWLDTGLYFAQGNKWYHTRAPQVEAVRIRTPVPQVLQRQRILSPQVIKEGNTIRLTRPSLTIP